MTTVDINPKASRDRLSRQIVRVLAILELIRSKRGATIPQIVAATKGDDRFFGCCSRTIRRDVNAAIFAGAVERDGDTLRLTRR